MWATFGKTVAQLVYLVCSVACLWPRSGKQERTARVPSFHAACGVDESDRCGPCNFAKFSVISQKTLCCEAAFTT